MRTSFTDEQIIASVDVPTGYQSDDHTLHIRRIVDFVEYSPHAVTPSGPYEYMKESLENRKLASRAGYHFRFWFDTLESANAFTKQVQGRLEVPPVLPRRKNT